MFDVVGKHSIADPVCRPFTITWSGYLHSRAYNRGVALLENHALL